MVQAFPLPCTRPCSQNKICLVGETVGCYQLVETSTMDRLYSLTDAHFEQINRLLPPEDSGPGRPPIGSTREALEGILHSLRTGTPWRDLPPAYGHWHTIYMRWQRWIERGV